MTIRVALIADTFVRNGAMLEGGAERHLLHLGQAMQGAGLDVAVYQPYDGTPVKAVGGVPVQQIRAVGPHKWSLLARAAARDGHTRFHFQYLEHVPHLPRGTVATATQHGVYWDIPYEQHARRWYQGGRAARAYLPLWRSAQVVRSLIALRRVRAVVAMDTSFLRVVQAVAPELRGRIFVTPPFSDIAPLAPDHEVALDELPPPAAAAIAWARSADALVVLVPRNVSLVRGGSWLTRIAELVDAEMPCLLLVTGLVLGGRGRPGVYSRLFAEDVRCLQLRSNTVRVVHLHSAPRTAMRALYGACEIVLIPTFAHEGASLAAAEAMALGRAVVSTNVGGLSDTLDDGWSGLVTRPDPQSIATGLLRLARDAELRNRLVEQGRSKAAMLFDLPNWEASQRPFFAEAGWLDGTVLSRHA